MKTKKQINSLKFYFLSLFLIIFLLFIVATSNTSSSFVTNNENNVKAVESSRIVLNAKKEITKIKVNTLEELKNNLNKKVEFVGTLTAYGPDCKGCSGKLGCYPYQNVLNNNIYYEDSTYGKIRILASDSAIPCGSIIKVSNYFDTEFFGIVLDRGSLVKGLTMDLLENSEKETLKIGRQYNINFTVERWGY